MQADDIGVSSDDPAILRAAVAGLLATAASGESADPAPGFGALADVVAALRETRLYCRRPAEPGFLAVGPPGHAMVPVFSSLDTLTGFDGACDWFALPGQDLLELLPQGYDIALDLGSPHPVRLDARLWRDPAVADLLGGSDG